MIVPPLLILIVLCVYIPIFILCVIVQLESASCTLTIPVPELRPSPPTTTVCEVTDAPVLMLSVPWPDAPTVSESVIVQFEFWPCKFTVPLAELPCPMVPYLLMSWRPFLILSVPVFMWPAPSK